MSGVYPITRRPLSDYVSCVWISEGYRQAHSHELVLPADGMSLIIDLDREDVGSVVMHGARSRPLLLRTSAQLRLMGVQFKPGGGFPFVGCPAGTLHNAHVPLGEFWPAHAAELRERLCTADTDAEKVRALAAFLLRRIHASRPSTPAVRYAIRQFQRAGSVQRVRDVTTEIGMSAERFIEVFRAETGLAPKLFARLARFRRAILQIERATAVEWPDVAVASGYFDQPHFIHDFSEFAGVTPSVYLRDRTSQNHIALGA